jgi:hypothetical protein
LEKLEKRAWRLNFEHGTFEIYLGIIIISFAPQLSLFNILPIPFNYLFVFLIIGGLIILIGVISLFKFLKKYYKQNKEADK